MGLGPVAYLVLLFLIISKQFAFLTWPDPVCMVVLVAMIVLRYVDITRFGGGTASGEPATLKHWRSYSGLVVAFGALSWLGAHILARYMTVSGS